MKHLPNSRSSLSPPSRSCGLQSGLGCGWTAAAAAPTEAAAEEKEEEKKKEDEPEDVDMGGLFGDDDDY